MPDPMLIPPATMERTMDTLHRKHAPRFQRAYMDAVERTASTPAAKKLGSWFVEHQSVPPMHLVDAVLIDLQPLARFYVDAAVDTGQQTFNLMERVSKAFGVDDPVFREQLAQAIKSVGADLDDASRKSLIRSMTKAAKGNLSPAELREVIGNSIGLDERYGLAVENMREGMVKNGATRADARAAANAYAKRLKKVRAETIAVTETARAMQMGQMAGYTDALRDMGIPSEAATVQWIVTRDDKLCSVCSPMTGEEVPFTNPQWTTLVGVVDGPPLHPHCRCTTTLRFPKPSRVQKGDRPGHKFRGNQYTVAKPLRTSLSERKQADSQFQSRRGVTWEMGPSEKHPGAKLSEREAAAVGSVGKKWIGGDISGMRDSARSIQRGKKPTTKEEKDIATTLRALKKAPKTTVHRGIRLTPVEVGKIKVGSVMNEPLATATGRRGLALAFASGAQGNKIAANRSAGRNQAVLMKMNARNIPIHDPSIKRSHVRGMTQTALIRTADERMISGKYKVVSKKKEVVNGVTTWIVEVDQV